MHCPASVTLSEGIEDGESEHASLGTNAHTLGEMCLSTDAQAWEFIGAMASSDFARTLEVFDVDKDMADAVQVYLDAIRTRYPERNQGNSWVERSFHCPGIHPQFYGTSDFCHFDEEDETLHVWDYKHGAGIVVEVEDNPQLMYYACGMLDTLDIWNKVETVNVVVCQPRGFHWNGPIREWSISTDDLWDWMTDVLVPAMDAAGTSDATASGEHCRFCPARTRACPQIMSDMDELEELMAAPAPELTNDQVGRMLDLFDIAKIAAKAAGETAFARLSSGNPIPGRKLANARANRIWKDDAEEAAIAKFKKAAFSDPELKSPAQIEKMSEGKAFSARYAYAPDAGLTVVKDSDNRPAVSKDTKSAFKDARKK